MSETVVREPKQFGQKKEPKTISISSNGKTRHFAINPIFFVACITLFSMFMVGYLVSTAYLAFRDDLISASFVRQARIKHEYEDRIAALRSKVDKITSRQMLDQQAVEAKVTNLIRQQELLSGQTGELQGLLKRAEKSGVQSNLIPVPSQNPLKPNGNLIDSMTTGSISTNSGFQTAFAGSFLRGSKGGDGNAVISINTATPSKSLFGAVDDQIKQIKITQYAKIKSARDLAKTKGKRILAMFDELNVSAPSQSMENIGGPFENERLDGSFDTIADELLLTLQGLDQLKSAANALPLGSPLPNAPLSSLFGNRVDPFHKRSAFHSGIDYKAKTGTPVRATGNGKVIKAGRKGGYGLVVILDHGNGITTRYAHLSRITVKPGQFVGKGVTIGKVGSTGRSTGPHLHYEVRRNEKATNPSRFLRTGRKLKEII